LKQTGVSELRIAFIMAMNKPRVKNQVEILGSVGQDRILAGQMGTTNQPAEQKTN
jgi:hypothetical protein